MRIWITRTQPGATRLAEVLLKAGHIPWVRPVIEIQPLEVPPLHERFDVGVVLSEHGAHFGARLLQQADQVLAVGEATRRTLEKLQISALTPRISSSEGLLEMAELSRANTSVLIVSGERPRTLLAQTLEQRGSRVALCSVYRRVPVAISLDDPDQIDGIVIASGEGFENTARWWHEAGGSSSVPVFVPSARVARLGAELKMPVSIDCHSAEPEAVLAAIDNYQREQHDRSPRR
ncbi:MAG: uroporphyrinogen-III synthase [Proteobacteria bacterium]|nr:uroporphyrinogen-III synthase [Pseudomonadota bacterium]